MKHWFYNPNGEREQLVYWCLRNRRTGLLNSAFGKPALVRTRKLARESLKGYFRYSRKDYQVVRITLRVSTP
jgi:hypothetical protein